ncbi:MAG: hypothetical protein NVS1B7_0480 [Candidatus Saccharimonadales bacterium]
MKRPLLDIPKQILTRYAQEQDIAWREDETNKDIRYTRNYVRHQVVANLSDKQRQQLLDLAARMHKVNNELDLSLSDYLHMQPAVNSLHRHDFIMLPHAISIEVLASWLRNNGILDFDRKTLQRLSLAAKTLQSGQCVDINRHHQFIVKSDILALTMRDR